MLPLGRSCLEPCRCGVQVRSFPGDHGCASHLAGYPVGLTPVFLQIQLSSRAPLPLKNLQLQPRCPPQPTLKVWLRCGGPGASGLWELGAPTVGHQGGSSAGAWDPDLNANSKPVLGEPTSPTGGHRGLPRQPSASSRLGLGRHRRLCSSNEGQISESTSDGSNHDYLPLVRTGEVEGGTAGARALSQLPSPPTSSLLRCDCKRRGAPSAWTSPSVPLCASLKSACAGPHPLLPTAPASAPPRPHLPGHCWALVLARVTVPRPPAASPPAQALRVQAKQTVDGAQILRSQKEWEGRAALTCGGAPGPQRWPWRGWSTAAPRPLASGN